MVWFAETVVKEYKACAWLSVILLYLMPIVFFLCRAYSILHDGTPAMQTSMSADWGSLPTFLFCSPEGHPKLAKCSLAGVMPINESMLAATATSPHGHGCILSKDKSEHEQFKGREELVHIAYTHLGSLKCVLVNATTLQPRAPSTLHFELLVDGSVKDSMPFLVLDKHMKVPLQTLTAFTPGNQVMNFVKKRDGSKRFSGNPEYENFTSKIFSPSLYLSAFSTLMSPELKDIYSTQLQYAYPDFDLEGIEAQNLSKWRPAALAKLAKYPPKLLSALEQGVTYQKYKATLKILNGHVLEEVEIGRYPQIFMLLARLGGYMSVLSAVLGLCWVQRWPDSSVAKIYRTRTFLLAETRGQPDHELLATATLPEAA
ncbi:unnamed protein product [Effrenium voratum]|uniref:Uncharacterized protein n=1 Tax=Effrenium voratum TaxID=2562239 RepID=A0AA36MZA0_9DINO|nr:unnamed protein product [Effrenium voratum]